MAECNDGFEGLKQIQLLQPDLIFLDIQMPKIDGFEMLELIESPPAVIFTTAFDQYALKEFAIDYLLKPFNKERFEKALSKHLLSAPETATPNKLQELLENTPKQPDESNRIVVKSGANIKIIPVEDVCYIEANDDYVKIYTAKGYSMKKKTMGFYENALDSQLFVRVHRSYIINIKEITRIEPIDKEQHMALLKNGGKIPISRSGYQKLKIVLGNVIQILIVHTVSMHKTGITQL